MKKLKLRRGFTLAELLISVLLLGLVSAMAAVMTSAVLSTTVTMQEVAHAEILGTEALENLQGELRFAKDISLAEGNLSYTRGNTESAISLEDGRIMLTTKTGKVNKTELFAGVSYGENLRISKLSYEFTTHEVTADGNTTKYVDAVKIDVSVSYGENVLWSGNVSVRPLNNIAETSGEAAG